MDSGAVVAVTVQTMDGGGLCLDAGHAGGSRHSVGGPGNRA